MKENPFLLNNHPAESVLPRWLLFEPIVIRSANGKQHTLGGEFRYFQQHGVSRVEAIQAARSSAAAGA
jgi:hypothetical protein